MNNAGVAPLKRRDILDMEEESFDRVLGVNLKGTLFLCQGAAKMMLRDKALLTDYAPRIINIGSLSAYTASTSRGEYCISKAGVSMVTKLFADRLAPAGIPVFEVRPGIIATDMTQVVHEKYQRMIDEGLLPVPRFGQPEDVARMVLACCSGLLDYSAGQVLDAWRGYSDPTVGLISETDGVPHHTITPIARRVGDDYELDLVLRSNITSQKHPLGVFHPHAEYHHIKKENIGLIEVMGLAVLPGRLKKEMADLREALLNGENLHVSEELSKHADWADAFMARHPEFGAENAEAIIQYEIGQVFARVLECAGVYKCTESGRTALKRFLTEVQNG